MNDKRYQVFVSSTYEDLKEERSKVIQALLRMNCIPIGMENFNAADEDQFTVIKELISSCDYYVLILAGRYGSIEEKSQKSYTQLEYEYAKSLEIPTIAFYRKNVEELPGLKIELDAEKKQKLEKFKRMVLSQLCMGYTSPEGLAMNVITSLTELIQKHPRIGWVRGDSISTAAANQRIIKLQSENEALQNELQGYKAKDEENSKKYQQHEDKITLRLLPFDKVNMNPFGLDLNVKPLDIELSWDEILRLVGGAFISPVRTNQAGDTLSAIICGYKECSFTHYLDGTCGQTILAQFYALHYIELKSSEVFQNGVESYYILTQYGMKEYVKLTAITKW